MRRWLYWLSTSVVVFVLASGGVGDVMRIGSVVEGMTQLGYPVYFCVILGLWKLLGAVALSVPGYPLVKEWAYAGALFDFTGAVASHVNARKVMSGTIAAAPQILYLF